MRGISPQTGSRPLAVGPTSYILIPNKGPTEGWSQSFHSGLLSWGLDAPAPCGCSRYGSRPDVPHVGPSVAAGFSSY